MKKPVFNPYLPSWEFVPDGEPHVFGDRVYIYGSPLPANGTYGSYIACHLTEKDLSKVGYVLNPGPRLVMPRLP